MVGKLPAVSRIAGLAIGVLGTAGFFAFSAGYALAQARGFARDQYDAGWRGGIDAQKAADAKALSDAQAALDAALAEGARREASARVKMEAELDRIRKAAALAARHG